MDNFQTPDAIEARAKAVGLTIKALCSRAKIAQSTFYRWKTGAAPITTNYLRVIGAIENAERLHQPAKEA